jgi:tripartite-type tricarboxylate transporter receptor subunit TctC
MRFMLSRRRFNRHVIGLGVAAGLDLPAFAQGAAYPSRPIKIVVPYAPGGGPDVLTRKMAVRLAGALPGAGAAIVVENIVGAGGIVAAQNVAHRPPDGYTLLLGASSAIVQKAMEPSVGFDPLTDFTPITRIAFSPSILVVGAASRYRTLDDLVMAARAAPGTLNYASGGVGSAAHLCAAAMALTARIDVVHVPYRGSVEIVPAIVSDAAQFGFPIASTALPQIQGGQVRALAVTSAQRLDALPDVPTLVEHFKTPDLALDAWFGLWAPAGTPPSVVDPLFAAVAQVYRDPAARADSAAAGAFVDLSRSPAEFAAFMAGETRKLAAIVAATKLSVHN